LLFHPPPSLYRICNALPEKGVTRLCCHYCWLAAAAIVDLPYVEDTDPPNQRRAVRVAARAPFPLVRG
jgi:hypothetical protein